jgi:hypothetical protein
MTLDPEQVLKRFPPVLRALVEAERAAGNTIVEFGGGHPAPPVGELIKLASALRTPLPHGLTAEVRNSSLYHTGITDDQRQFWILTAPHQAPAEPDMDAIRAAHSPPVSERVAPVQPAAHIELDHRGELILYREADRRTDVMWTWNGGHRLYRTSLTHWWYFDERRSVELTPMEKAVVLDRIIRFAHAQIGPVEVVD